MRKAEMIVVNNTKKFEDDRPAAVLIQMYWQWMPPPMDDSRSWKCLPGYLRAASGYWKDHYFGGGVIDFFDRNGDFVGTAYGVDLGLIGYPLDGLAESRQTGLFSAATGGLISYAEWRFVMD